MVHKRLVLIPLLVALATAPALAKPTVIAELGTAPLLGTSTSTAEMRERVAHNERMVATAATRIGLTPSEYAQFRTAIASSHVAWVTVPRHLDAMSWQSGGTVYVLHDVVIPAGTNGWEVDVRAHHQLLALYMPAKCGNLSVVRKSVPVVAIRRPRPVRVAALKVTPPETNVASAPIAAAPASVPAPAAIPDDSSPAVPVTVAAAEFPPVAAASAHHLPLFLAPLLVGLAALTGGGSSGSIGSPAAGNCP